SRLVVERIFTIQGEQDQHKLIHCASQASGRPITVGAHGELAGERSESELSCPKIVLQNTPTQGLGVVRDPPLQHAELRFGIEHGDTHRDLAEVRSAEEPEGWLLGIVKLVPAGFRLGDYPLQMFEAAIYEIDALAADREPRPTIDPRAPLVEAGDHW